MTDLTRERGASGSGAATGTGAASGGGPAARLEARIAELEQRIDELERERSAAERRASMLRRMVPPEATDHFRAAAREQLRGCAVMLDHWIRGLEASDVEHARSNSSPERIVIE